MSRTPAAADLRARMQRVAAKPRKPHTPAAPLQARRTPNAVRHARAKTTPQSRVRTLAAWASWELTSVPARRWNWFMAIIRGRANS
jgi:hypothetical protein